MNKKILSIFVMVMALSLLGVSCNKKTTDPTNDGGSTTTTTQITDTQIQTALRTGLGNSLAVNDTDNLDANTGTYANGTFTITEASPSKAGENATAKGSVEGKLTAIKQELDKIGITCSTSEVTFTNSSADSSCTLDITVKSGYKLPNGTSNKITIKITLTGQTWS
ncbi:hypothetical protein R4K55_01095 [Brachyspira alvinipulli]|uniref:hypothetical protein n=1 Tax=Brachyspira alvinipulli TaxID=84379 RepID=UPI003006073F